MQIAETITSAETDADTTAPLPHIDNTMISILKLMLDDISSFMGPPKNPRQR